MFRVINKRTLMQRLFIYFLPLSLIGVLIGAPFLLLFLGTASLLFWHYKQLYRLSDWLHNQKSFNPPEGEGSWEQIFDGIYRLQHRHRDKRNELAGLIKRFREGAEAVPDAVIVLQKDLSIVWCNKLAVHVLGLEWPGDSGQRLDNLIRHPKFAHYMQANDYYEPLELDSPLGTEQMLEFRVMPYETQLMVVVRDVTELKMLEQIRKDFVANVSHELRTPLTVISGYLEMMDAESMPPLGVWGKAHGTMSEQCQRMNALVNQLLILSRMEGPRKTEQDELVDVPNMLKLILIQTETLNIDKKHVIELDIDQKLFMFGKVEELRSAFSNLIFNAIHYIPEPGHIRIVWKIKDAEPYFAVYDNGDGIAPEHIGRLTERFYRVDQARSRKTGGSGLGLAITKHVLSRHESHLDIVSKVGQGSCFSFSFSSERVKKF
ncbi:two-component system sensor histidine kinase PhoR [Pseudoalteromonas sp. NBT06-2]|uniref:phosphate regulon sensor histidine kinase PhoR n=1 Tax=Pseudoalteromonas sp. NBT06-2 TaxID=2025950 RepID=UPI000BA7B918|nr:phosphate regulon sensor histidine kinase PhoR [Pseudoalteromonas sp. NBT06-2]PAJ75835.1 two-component system sensor histidine kinase PhoR [Pseudoalteromonas sp. NBT06-2]